ncbi:MAG: septum formation initiator family protein [Actinomycetota bacterium]
MSAPAPRLRTVKDRERARLVVVRRRSRSLIKRGTSRRVAPLMVAAAIVLGASVLTVLLAQVVLAQSAFKLEALARKVNKAVAEREEMRLEAATLESPARIEHYARTELGMVDPVAVEYIVADIARRGGGRLALRFPSAPPDSEEASAAGLLTDEESP